MQYSFITSEIAPTNDIFRMYIMGIRHDMKTILLDFVPLLLIAYILRMIAYLSWKIFHKNCINIGGGG